MGINSYGEPWSIDVKLLSLTYRERNDYLESELELIDRALSHALDALESDSTLEQRREAFEMIQDLYGSRDGSRDRILSQMYPPESIKHCLPDDENETKEVTNG